jgi:hypothetical protein
VFESGQPIGPVGTVGTVGDAYDNAAAERFVDCFKTELIRDRVWRTRTRLELATVEYVAWSITGACTPRWTTARQQRTSSGTWLRENRFQAPGRLNPG